MNEFYVTAEESGVRIDALLTQYGLTRSAAQRLIAKEQVTRDGKSVKKSEVVELGDTYRVVMDEPVPVELLPENIPLDVMYEDDDVIVLNGHPVITIIRELDRAHQRSIQIDTDTGVFSEIHCSLKIHAKTMITCIDNLQSGE